MKFIAQAFRFQKRRLPRSLACCAALLLTAAAAAETLCEPRAANTTLTLPLRLPVMGYGTVDALPGLRFANPVAMAAPPGETNRLAIAERGGRIWMVPDMNVPEKVLLLDLSAKTQSYDIELGLLGITFHPGFATNGYFYVFHTLQSSSTGYTNILHDRLSRYTISEEDPNRADPASELVIINQVDAGYMHNAGDLHFGPDGYLYISMGDSKPPKDAPGLEAQALDSHLFGGILRIDVDKREGNLPPNPHPGGTENYLIPADNPFIGLTEHNGEPVDPAKLRTEFFAIGFRNPWRFTFHPVTGELYCADVGHRYWEELNRVEKGGNYGWPYFEGTGAMWEYPPAPAGFTYTPPILTYLQGEMSTNQGNAIIGGKFYFGEAMPDLRGAYIFGDYTRGHIWWTRVEHPEPQMIRLTGVRGISAFALDPRDGEILISIHEEGRIRKLVFVPPDEPEFPRTLADTGAFADLAELTPNPGIVPYSINAPFWSDYAIKRRWFSLPSLESTIDFAPATPWGFPEGSVWIKHFELELTNGVPESRRRIETRFIVRNEDGVYGVTYRWDDAQENAFLVPDEGRDEVFTIWDGSRSRQQTWRYPSRTECLTCHTEGGGWALGFNTAQLNRDISCGNGPRNQIGALAEAGYFTTPPSSLEPLPRLLDPRDESAPLEPRVRSYFQANCAMCHQPGEEGQGFWDARLSVSLADMGLLGTTVLPGSPNGSRLISRLNTGGTMRMPPVGSFEFDHHAIGLVREWIQGLPAEGGTRLDFGGALREGSTIIRDGMYEVTGSGGGLGGEVEGFHFYHQPLPPHGRVTARFRGWLKPAPNGEAGLLIRSAEGSHPAVFLGAGGDGVARFRARTGSGPAETIGELPGGGGPVWLSLARSGTTVNALVSTNGQTWTPLGSRELFVSGDLPAGLAVASGSKYDIAAAHLDEVSRLAISLKLPEPGAVIELPGSVQLAAEISGDTNTVAAVAFFSGTEKIAEITAPPYAFLWTNPPPGTLRIRAEAIDDLGLALPSETVEVEGVPPPAGARYLAADLTRQGGWKGEIGGAGYFIPDDGSRLPGVRVTVQGEIARWNANPTDPRFLISGSGEHRVAAAIQGSEIWAEVRVSDVQPRILSLYFLDYDRLAREQEITIEDLATREVLDQAVVSDFGEGVYLSFAIRGSVRVRVRSLNEAPAVLNGMFLDETAVPSIDLAWPLPGSVIPASSPLPLIPLPSSAAGVQSVSYYLDRQLAAVATEAPFIHNLAPPSPGPHTISARVEDQHLSIVETAPVPFTIVPAQGAAALAGVDAETSGGWRGKYGSEGYYLVGLGGELPPYVTLTNHPASVYTFSTATHDPRALQKPEGDFRWAVTWVSLSSFQFELMFHDAEPHLVSLYTVDYNSGSRRMEIEAYDAATGIRFTQHEVADFYTGKYYQYRLQGHVRFVVKAVTDHALLNGIFFDPATNTPPVIRITRPAPGTPVKAGEPIHVAVEASARVERVRLYLDGGLVGELPGPPYEFTVPYFPEEPFQFRALAFSPAGNVFSSPVEVVPTPAPPAGFITVDPLRQGAWEGFYGQNGFILPGTATNMPPGFSWSLNAAEPHVWAEATDAPGALLHQGARKAAAFLDPAGVEFSCGFDEAGRRQLIAFYFLDWDSQGREVELQALHPVIGVPLSRHTVKNFQNGKYVLWEGEDRVRFRIVPANPAAGPGLAGIFLSDPLPGFESWKRAFFSSAELNDPAISGEDGNPDGDSLANLDEYLMGGNPVANSLGRERLWITGENGPSLFYQNALVPGYWLEPRTSADLLNWEPAEALFERKPLGRTSSTAAWLLELKAEARPSGTHFFRLAPRRIE